jgi:alpha-mannosidase
MAKPTLHLICNAHLDPVWQWRWEEGCGEALSTFATAAEILRERPGLVFNHNEAVLYEWVLAHDPALFKEIQKLVRLGRWHIAGGWYLQPDVNLPGIESIIRQIALGRQFFRKHFNAAPKVAYNFDSFGHGGGLPQVLKQAGYEMYIHMRPQEEELRLPSDLYHWRGVDGSSILAYRIAVGLYHTERDNILQRLEAGTELALRLNRDVPVFWGIGDHGGGATRDDLDRIDEFMRGEKRVRVVHSTTDRLYAALKKHAHGAPELDGDIQRVFTGCYTSLSRLKRRSIRSLGEIIQAEAASTMSWWNLRRPYPKAEWESIWKDHLFNDFHDILPGSCTEPAEQDALDQYGRASEGLRRLRVNAVHALHAGTMQRLFIPVSVLNTNTALRAIPVEAECMLDLRPKWTGRWHLRVYDMRGNELPSQEEQPESLLPFNGWRRKVTYLPELPGCGLAHYEIRIHEGEREDRPGVPMLPHLYDEQQGLVTSLETPSGAEVVKSPLMQGLIVDDDGDAWGANRWSYRDIKGVFAVRREKNALLASGPIRTTRQSVHTAGSSTIVVTMSSYPALPVLEYRIRVQWNEVRRRLKFRIPTSLADARMFCEIPGGAIARPEDGEEHVHARWCMITGKVNGGLSAVGVVNNGQHGLDFKDGELRLSALRSAAYCHEQGFALGDSPARKYMDQGVHELHLLVTAGSPDEVAARLPGLADWVSAPPAVYTHLPIGRSERMEFLTVTPSTVRATAIKPSWDGKALVVRLQEASGNAAAAIIGFPGQGTKKQVTFQAFEMKTFRVERTGRVKECSLIEEK